MHSGFRVWGSEGDPRSQERGAAQAEGSPGSHVKEVRQVETQKEPRGLRPRAWPGPGRFESGWQSTRCVAPAAHWNFDRQGRAYHFPSKVGILEDGPMVLKPFQSTQDHSSSISILLTTPILARWFCTLAWRATQSQKLCALLSPRPSTARQRTVWLRAGFRPGRRSPPAGRQQHNNLETPFVPVHSCAVF